MGNATNTKSRFSPRKQIGRRRGPGWRRRLHLGPLLPPPHLIRPRTVPAITDHLPIYQDKMYIFHENGFCSPAAL